jgi:hypothetical protein
LVRQLNLHQLALVIGIGAAILAAPIGVGAAPMPYAYISYKIN